MFHSNTERLIDYWRARKDGGLSPLRSDIDPADLTDLLPQMFILGRVAPGEHAFRLAGGLPSDLHQRDLRNVNFLTLWAKADRPRLGAAIHVAHRNAEPVVLEAEAQTPNGPGARIEILIAPMRADQAPAERCLGLYQPLSPDRQLLRGRGVRELALIRSGAVEHEGVYPRLRLAAVDGELVAAEAVA
jgi:hypothetical protein